MGISEFTQELLELPQALFFADYAEVYEANWLYLYSSGASERGNPGMNQGMFGLKMDEAYIEKWWMSEKNESMRMIINNSQW